MRKLAVVTALGGALVLASHAAAGGMATVGISPTPEDGFAAGATWKPTIRVLQHGRTPATGAQPRVEIRNVQTGEVRTFTARPAREPGVYTAEVAFPSRGSWTYRVYDGFTSYGGAQWHTFAPVTIGPAAAGGGPDWMPWAGGLGLAAMLAAASALLVTRRRRARPQVATAM